MSERHQERAHEGGMSWIKKEGACCEQCVCMCVCAFQTGGRVSLSCTVAVNYLTRLAFLKQWLWNVVSLKTICVSAVCNNWTGLHTCMCMPCLWYHRRTMSLTETYISNPLDPAGDTRSAANSCLKIQRKHTNSCCLPFRQAKT